MKPGDTTEVICLALFHVFRHIGTKPFKKSIPQAWFCILFPFLMKRIPRHRSDYRNYDKFRKLFYKHLTLPKAAERRYRAGLFEPLQLLEVHLPMGCMNKTCPALWRYAQLLRKKKQLGKITLSADEEKYLTEMGTKVKLCR
jgi:hypothetical protein